MFCVLFAVHSGPENLSYFPTVGTRLAPLVFLVCKCLIIQGGSRAALRSQPKKKGCFVSRLLCFVFCLRCILGLKI